MFAKDSINDSRPSASDEAISSQDYGVEGAKILAAKFVRGRWADFSAWLEASGIDPEDCSIWIERQESLAKLAPILARPPLRS